MGASAVITLYSLDIKRVFAAAAQPGPDQVHLIWLQMGGDSGCTVSMLQAANPNLIEAVTNLNLSADFWQTLMTPDYDLGWVSAGYTTEDKSFVPLANAAFGDAPVDVLIVEGTPQLGTPKGGSQGDFCTIGEIQGKSVTAYDLLQKLAAKASYVVAVGQCSAFGGIPAAAGNVTGAVPLTAALKTAGVATKNPVINIPGCPANPDWTLITLASVLQGFKPDLDALGRPTAFFSSIIHDNCPRRGAYEAGNFAYSFDDPVGCLWKLGCKGPITYSSCAKTKWNSGAGFCTQAGPMCWGCMHPSFPDPPVSPFFQEIPGFPGINIPTLEVAGAAAAVVGVGVAAGIALKSKKKEEEETAPAGGSASP
jgi:hydrogenase small subunit